MAASSSPSPYFESTEGDPMSHPYQQQSQLQPQPQIQQHQHSLAVPPSSSSAPQPKKKRSLPGTPSKYPDAEVIALSPKTLMATNRFICEVCNKGFQREQNLQLHRRGHNLPWKLKQKSNKEQVKRKVYLCPEPTCVHHDPARALGDLTGIKKHYSRKHGEKKFKCDKCSKRYAVQSDWKAHSKTCGTREYRCDCGTLFSRRDSFITHRAFCDALAQESARHPGSLTTLGSHLFGPAGATATTTNNIGLGGVGLSQMTTHLSSLSDHTTANILRLGGAARPGGHFDHLLGATSFPPQPPSSPTFYLSDHHHHHQGGGGGGVEFTSNDHQDNQTQNSSGGVIFSNKLFPGQLGQLTQLPDLQGNSNSFNLGFFPDTDTNTSFFSGPYTTGPNGPNMSATALLQKASQMGSTTSASNASATALLKNFPPSSTSSSSPNPPPPPTTVSGFGGVLFGDQNDQNNLHDLMNSLAGGGPWTTSPLGDHHHHNNNNNSNNPQQEGAPSRSGSFNPNKLTRDFLGVGQNTVRSMSGGNHQQQQEGINANAASSTTSSLQAFGGGFQ